MATDAVVKDMAQGAVVPTTTPEPFSPGIVFAKFADVEIPEFKEYPNKDYVFYGKSNLYPQYLTYLYNKSSKHSAIINGKTKYIFGNGFIGASQDELYKQPAINRDGETWDDVAKKGIKDAEIYGGFRLMVIWNVIGSKPADIFHVEFEKLRADKVSGYWYCFNWADTKEVRNAIHYPEFNPKDRTGVQIFAYNEYRPGSNIYPLPEYLACNNYIEVDIEISKFHLSAIKNGMMPSKAIEFFIGDVPDEKKREIERRFERKFSGAENAGKFVMIFNNDPAKSVKISDLSASELDKQFDILNKTTQQEIFTGHQVTSPMLFGIKEEGQLGGATELYTAYGIFTNTYAKPKRQDIEKVVNYFQSISGLPADLFLQDIEPIGNQIDISTVVNSLPKEYVFRYLGIPQEDWDKPNIGQDNRPTPTIAVAPPTLGGAVNPSQKILDALSAVSPLVATKILDNLTREEIRSLAGVSPTNVTSPVSDGTGDPLVDSGLSTDDTPSVVNDSIKNLTAKQHQQLMRIIRQYGKEQITKEAATVLLKTGLGLTDADINSLLGIDDTPVELSSQEEDHIITLFNKLGEDKRDYHLIKSKKVRFSSDDEAFEDELNFFKQSFTASVSVSEADILKLISKDRLITPEIIANALGVTPEYVTSKIAKMVKNGLLNSTDDYIGEDVQIERTLTVPLDDITADITDNNQTIVSIKYSYEGPQDSRNRPFCAKMMELNRLYSRVEIENISAQLGYSVFDRRGGFWRHKGTDITTPHCRHNWMSQVVVKKGVKS